MVFATPAALAGAATVAGLVAVYLYHSRFRREKVPSLLFWHAAAAPSAGGARRDVLRPPPIFYLECAVLALLVLAAAGPLVRRGGAGTLVVVWDASASMEAKGRDGRTARDRALDALRRAVRAKPYVAVRTVVADPAGPRALGTLAAGDAVRRLEGWDVLTAGDALGDALRFARAKLAPGDEVLVLTDHLPPPEAAVTAPVTWLAVGEPAENAAIVHAERTRPDDGGDRVYAEIATPRAVLTATLAPAAGGAAATYRLEARNGRARLALTLPAGAPDMRLSIPDDALALDNAAALPVPAGRRPKVAITVGAASLRRAVLRALRASGRAETTTNAAAADLVFTDGAAPVRRRAVRFVAPRAPVTVTGPYWTDPGAAVLEGAAFDGLAWAAGTNTPPGRALVVADRRPVITQEHGGRTIYVMAADGASAFFKAPAWPELVWNILAAAADALPGPTSGSVRLGGSIEVATETGEAAFTPPGGLPVTVRARGGVARWTPPRPGVYGVRTGTVETRVAVGLFNAAESDLAGNGAGRRGGGATADADHDRSYAGLAGLAALALLVLHGYLISRAGRAGKEGA